MTPPHRLLLLLLSLIWTACTTLPQPTTPTATEEPSTLRYQDHIYAPHIRTVQFLQEGRQNLPPVLFLDDVLPLSLEFDALLPPEAEPETYDLTIIPCNAQWQPAGLLPMEYYTGFNTERIYHTARSHGTRVPYAHYAITIPADGAAFKRSGNYLLKITLTGDPDHLILTRRLLVAERTAVIQAQLRQATLVQDRARRQRVDFDVLLTGNPTQAYDPMQDVQATVLRNFRWHDAITDLHPRFSDGQRLQFIVPAGEEFEGGNEYRWADLRNPGFHKARVPNLPGLDSIILVQLPADRPRLPGRYAAGQDENGGFYIDAFGIADPTHAAEYVLAQFTLKAPQPLPETKVYLTGGFCAWQLDPENELTYDPAHYAYTTSLLLKQGVYDYAYITVGPDNLPDEQRLEGSHADTENIYTILIYLQNPAEPMPRIIGLTQLHAR